MAGLVEKEFSYKTEEERSLEVRIMRLKKTRISDAYGKKFLQNS